MEHFREADLLLCAFSAMDQKRMAGEMMGDDYYRAHYRDANYDNLLRDASGRVDGDGDGGRLRATLPDTQ